MGANLANLIDANGLSINDYLNKIKINPNSMYFQPNTPTEIHEFIDKLPSKTSSGYDGILQIVLLVSQCHVHTSMKYRYF